MRYHTERAIPHVPPRAAFERLREITPTLAGRIPSVTSVEVLSQEGSVVRLKWSGHGDLPRVARAIIKPHDVYWIDETDWDEAALEARTLITRPGIAHVRSAGTMRFRPHASGGTFVDVAGDLHLGFPVIGPLLERFFAGHARDGLARTLAILDEDLRARPPP